MRYTFVATDIGRLLVAGDNGAVASVHFDGGEPDDDWIADDGSLREVSIQLRAYLNGKLKTFTVPLAPRGTEFQRAVWNALLEIPYGETRSYSEIARAIGRPDAVRAVGTANGANPIPIIIPCHRVIGANGSLTGFGGGLDVKRQLLMLEALHTGLFANA